MDENVEVVRERERERELYSSKLEFIYNAQNKENKKIGNSKQFRRIEKYYWQLLYLFCVCLLI